MNNNNYFSTFSLMAEFPRLDDTPRAQAREVYRAVVRDWDSAYEGKAPPTFDEWLRSF